MVTNLSHEPQTINLGEPARIAVLDTSSFDAATRQADWTDAASRKEVQEFTLPQFAVAFLETSKSTT